MTLLSHGEPEGLPPASLLFFLVYSSALKMQAMCYSETSGCLLTTGRYYPEQFISSLSSIDSETFLL
jgi:hypothetical protein